MDAKVSFRIYYIKCKHAAALGQSFVHDQIPLYSCIDFLHNLYEQPYERLGPFVID